MRRTLAMGLLLSSFVLTAAAYASDDVSASAPRVSTGITPPAVINSLSINSSDTSHFKPAMMFVTVSYTVDASGQPRNIQVLKGSDPYWNTLVTAAVEKLRYHPAMLDNQPVPMGVTLNVTLQ